MSRRQPDAPAGRVGHGAWSQMVWTDGKTGRTDSNRDGSATNQNREHVGKLARAWRCAMNLVRGQRRRETDLAQGEKRELFSPQSAGLPPREGVRGGPQLPSHSTRPGLRRKSAVDLASRGRVGSVSSSE